MVTFAPRAAAGPVCGCPARTDHLVRKKPAWFNRARDVVGVGLLFLSSTWKASGNFTSRDWVEENHQMNAVDLALDAYERRRAAFLLHADRGNTESQEGASGGPPPRRSGRPALRLRPHQNRCGWTTPLLRPRSPVSQSVVPSCHPPAGRNADHGGPLHCVQCTEGHGRRNLPGLLLECRGPVGHPADPW